MAFGIGDSLVTKLAGTMEAPATGILLSFLMLPLSLQNRHLYGLLIALQDYLVNASGRQYQFWERNPLSIDLWNKDVLIQKLIYIHNNPLS
jgi:hypothetical protein